MLSSFKGKGPESPNNASSAGLTPAGFANIIAPAAPAPRLPAEPAMPTPRPVVRPPEPPPAPKPEAISSIGASMSIVGQVVCTGQARLFGRVEGDVQVSDLLLGAGSQVEGNVVAQEVTVRGHVKGTIRAVKVRLEDGAIVEGDIFHRSLAIEEGAVFEGSSKRVDNPTEAPVSMPEAIQQRIDHQDALAAVAVALQPAAAPEPAAPTTEVPRAEQLFR
jgi:cytoskeletal protein CcmA (bactofilin family)